MSSRFPFHELLGLEILQQTDGESELRLVIADKHLRDSGILHGGVLATLIDAGVGLAARSRSPEGANLVTVQLNSNFLRTTQPGDVLSVRGQVLHYGRRTIVASAEVRSADGRLVATGTATLLSLLSPAAGER